MAEEQKKLSTEKQVGDVLDLGDKNTKTIRKF